MVVNKTGNDRKPRQTSPNDHNLQAPANAHKPPANHSCYGWKWHFLAKKHYTIQKNIHKSVKTYDILLK